MRAGATGELDQLSDIQVDDLTVSFGRTPAIRNVSLSVYAGEVLGLVGETGSGKTTLCRAIAGTLPAQAKLSGSVHLNGRPGRVVRQNAGTSLGARIGFVFQAPDAALNPCIRVGTQVTELLVARGEATVAAYARAREMLKRMGLENAEKVLRSYPHELSGGQQQRVCIAVALLIDPEVLLLDEPTTALDVTTQASILSLLREVLTQMSIPVVFVTHDLRLVATIANRLAVMTEGEIVEMGPRTDVLKTPLHPYTSFLIGSQPEHGFGDSLPPAQATLGSSPSAEAGCGYAPRCPIAERQCLKAPVSLRDPIPGHWVRCLRPEAAAALWVERPPAMSVRQPTRPLRHDAALLKVSGVDVDLGVGRRRTRILTNISFTIGKGRTIAVVGETGAGKSTLARAIQGLVHPVAGEIRLGNGKLPLDIRHRSKTECARVQMVFQSSAASLNPRRTVEEILGRTMRRLGKVPRSEVTVRLPALLEQVQLPMKLRSRRTAHLSGGEKQRVAIARALAAAAELVILDEAVSALDVSTQATILRMLKRVQADLHLTYLFITHDLAVVRQMSDDLVVLYGGRIVETGPIDHVLGPVHHPYTEVLLRSLPTAPPLSSDSLRALDGGLNRASVGCVFAERCPWRLGKVCTETPPPIRQGPDGHQFACHYEVPVLRRILEADRQANSGRLSRSDTSSSRVPSAGRRQPVRD